MELQNDDFRFKNVFRGNVFKIPDYQRHYSWESKHFNDLWEDLLNVIDREQKDHYMGTIICKDEGELETEKHHDSQNKYQIVDGQQRLTTLTILINELIYQYKNIESKKSDIPVEDAEKNFIKHPNIIEDINSKLRLQEDDNDVFLDILENRSNPDPETPSQRKLIEARDFFREQIQEIRDTKENDEVEELIGSLLSTIKNLQFMVYKIDTEEKATLIFESVNDRGKGLTNLEKTKSFLMHKIYLAKDNGEDELNRIKRRFSRIYKHIQNIQSHEDFEDIGEDQIQRYHFIASMEKKHYREYLKEKDDKHRTRKNAASNYLEILKYKFGQLHEEDSEKCVKEIENYVDTLEEFFRNFKDITEYSENKSLQWEIEKLIRMGRLANFYPLILTIWKKKDHLEYEELRELLQLIEVAGFRIYAIRSKRSDTGMTKFYKLAYNFYHGEIESEEVEKRLKETTENYADQESFENDLKQENFYKNITKSDARYLFYFYDREEIESNNDKNIEYTLEGVIKNPKRDYTLDHIWPQKDEQLELDEETHEEWENNKHRLGNLTLASRSHNASWQDKPPKEKIEEYKNNAFATTRELGKQSEGLEVWNKNTIQKRTQDIVDFARKRWSLDSKDRNEVYLNPENT